MSDSKKSENAGKDDSLLMASLKEARNPAAHIGVVSEITGEKYAYEKAQQFLVYLAYYTFCFSNDYNLVLASWGLLDGIKPGLKPMERRAELAKQFGYKKDSSHKEDSRYETIERQLLKNGFVIDEENLDEKARLRNRKKREEFIAEAFSGKYDLQVPARPYRVNDAITKGKDKTGLVYPKPRAVLNEINVVPGYKVKNLDKVPSFPLAESPNSRFVEAEGLPDLISKLEEDLANLQYSAKRLLELEPRANAGDTDAQFELGGLYCKKQDHEKAKKWLLAAAEQNHVTAQMKLSVLFILHPEWENSGANALYWAEKAAMQGDSHAQYLAGRCYHYGIGTRRDYGRAAECYKRSLEQGVHDAANNLGLLYLHGQGVARDYAEALRLFKITLDDGVITAAHNIGTVYKMAADPIRDIQTAITWFNFCAENEYIPSQVMLGMIYLHGDGVEQDYRLANYWLKKAADHGDANAQYFLGYLYQQGLGTDRDYDKAFYWLRKSAEQGFPRAQVELGRCYHMGIGTEPDLREAIKWFTKAVESDGRLAGMLGIAIEGLKNDLRESANP